MATKHSTGKRTASAVALRRNEQKGIERKDHQLIPNRVEFTLQSKIFNNFRCKMACDSLDIDIDKKSTHHVQIENIALPDGWSVGLIVGASGSGKTTLAKHIFGSDIFRTVLNEAEPIINQFPEELTYDECATLLTGIGLNSVPCWVRPVSTLSNGQKARAEAALLMVQKKLTVIDEWTSVVDRTVAKAMSHCVQKFARKNKKQIILLSCHYDIIEWIKPDWIIDCNKQEFQLPEDEGFFLHQKKSWNSKSEPLEEKHGKCLASIII